MTRNGAAWLPAVVAQSTSDNGATYCFTLQLHRESPLYAGHFPNWPIVPGVALVQWVIDLLACHGTTIHPEEVRRLKFMELVLPGDQLDLRCRRSPNKLEFAYRRDQTLVCRGEFALATP